jgi:ATP-dependent Lhr-like helicase
VPTADAVAQPDRSTDDLAAADRDELAEAVAELLLHRWGVLFRDLVQHDSLRFPWRDLQWALRRLEDRGLVRGGRFVSGFSGEQYALPTAAEQLTQVRRSPRESERVTVNATDPLNLVGVIVPGARVPAVRTNRVTFVDGVVGGDGPSPESAETVGTVEPGEAAESVAARSA